MSDARCDALWTIYKRNEKNIANGDCHYQNIQQQVLHTFAVKRLSQEILNYPSQLPAANTDDIKDISTTFIAFKNLDVKVHRNRNKIKQNTQENIMSRSKLQN